MEILNLATNWNKKKQPSKQANRTCLWAWFYSWAQVCETLSETFLVFCDIILEGMKDCSISFWHYWFPKYGLTLLFLWSTIWHHPLVISEFAHPFTHQFLPPPCDIMNYANNLPLHSCLVTPFTKYEWPYHLGMTTHFFIPLQSFAYFFASSPCVMMSNLIPGLQLGMGSGKIQSVASQKDEVVWKSSWCHKTMSALTEILKRIIKVGEGCLKTVIYISLKWIKSINLVFQVFQVNFYHNEVL